MPVQTILGHSSAGDLPARSSPSRWYPQTVTESPAGATPDELLRTLAQRKPSIFVVVAGPSGVGKDAVLNRMRAMRRPFHFVVTMTTRGIREGEANGVDYHFATRDQFVSLRDGGGLLEWAVVYGNLYGVP